MDQKGTNPYSTEIPVSEAEQQIATSAPAPQTPNPTPEPPTQTQPIQQTTAQSVTPPPPTTGAPLPPPPARMHSSIVPKLIIGVLIVAILGLSGYIVKNITMTKSAPTPTPTMAQAPTPTSLPTATPTPMQDVATTSADPGSNRFYSQDLGILFDTAKTLPGNSQTVKTWVNGSRVYVYVNGTVPTAGQYVDVLSKVSTDDVATAAQKITANDPKFKGCTFTLSDQTVYPATYQKAVPTCQPTAGAGLSFFLTDSDYPTRLLFVSIGQYAILAGSDPQKPWQDTIRFLPNAQPNSADLPKNQ